MEVLREKQGDTGTPQRAPIVRLQDVSTDLAHDIPLVPAVSLTLHAGERMRISGPPCTGKSTLLHFILGMARPRRGRVEVWGQEPWTLSQQDIVSLRRRIGFVPDRGELIKNLSLFDNLVLPLRYHTQPPEQEVRQRANELLALMEIARLPQVPTSRADRRLAQKIALARALILEPELLLLDQPTHDFDVDFADYVWRLLDDVCGKRNVAVLAMVRDQQEGRSLTDNHLSLAAEWAGNMWCAAAPAHD